MGNFFFSALDLSICFAVVLLILFLLKLGKAKITEHLLKKKWHALLVDFILLVILPSLISGTIIVLIIQRIDNFRTKNEITGCYEVQILREKDYIKFGYVFLYSSYFENKLKFKGYNEENGCEVGNQILEGEGKISNFRFITGHYWKVTPDLESRFGSFLYEIDGTGKVFDGVFVFIDRDTLKPSSGKARWVKI